MTKRKQNRVRSMARILIKSTLHRVGFDLVPYYANPQNTLLGITNYPIRTILDVGANIGQSAQLYRRLFPDAMIYCFEPLPSAYCTLEAWAQTQKSMVKTFNIALGNQTDEVEMNYHIDHSPSSSLLKTTALKSKLYPQTKNQTTVTVMVDKLDSISDSLEICRDIMIKMDVQGYESQVIEGGKQVLSQSVACILEVSLVPLYEGQATFDGLVNSMHALGFEYAGNLSQTYSGKSVAFVDAVFLKSSN